MVRARGTACVGAWRRVDGGAGGGSSFAGAFVRPPVLRLTVAAAVSDELAPAAAFGAGGCAAGVAAGFGHVGLVLVEW